MKLFFKFFSYFPGLVILALGMLALHSSLNLMQVYDGIIAQYGEGAAQAQDMKYHKDWLYWSVIAISFAGFVLAVLNARKVSELKHMHNEKKFALREMEGRLAALEMAREGILILGCDYEVIYVNRALCMMTGVDSSQRENMLGKPWCVLFSEADFEIVGEDIVPEIQEQGFWIGDFPIYREDGSVVNTEMSFTRVPDGGLVGTIQDVSDKQKAEDEKRALEEQFYQAQKMEAIGRLAGGIAHDFNNILASMNGYAEFLLDDLEEESEQRKFAQNILAAGVQARELVDQMLAFSRHADSASETVDICDAVKEVLSMLASTLPRTVELYDNLAVKRAIINGNATQISQLLMNLCVNAQDAMEGENGKLTISMEHVTSDEINITDEVLRDELPCVGEAPYLMIEDIHPGSVRLILSHMQVGIPYIKLHIEDTGSGMSRAVMEHIFEPFFTTKPVDKGTGLGLATVHGVVTSHQGFMTILSVIGEGTAFDLYFPLIESEVEEAPVPELCSEQGQIQKMGTILLVEDQEDVRVMMMQMLSRLGYDAICAVSGRDGLEVVRENPKKYDLVITDHNMPEMTGQEMIECLHREFPKMPFIMLSGYNDKQIQEIVNNHPAIKSVLKKPVSKSVLAQNINDALAA